MTHYSEHMPFATDKWQTTALGGDYSGVAKALGDYSERVDQPENISSSIKSIILTLLIPSTNTFTVPSGSFNSCKTLLSQP